MFSFSRLIESSLGSVATKFNFFIHNLAQLRFSGLPSNDEPILSFSAKTYSLKQDGRIKQVSVFTYQKRYNPDKHYVSMWELFPLREDNGVFSPNQTQQGQLTKTGQRNIPQCIMSLSAVNLGVEEESRGPGGGCLPRWLLGNWLSVDLLVGYGDCLASPSLPRTVFISAHRSSHSCSCSPSCPTGEGVGVSKQLCGC